MAIALDGETRRYRKGIALHHMQDTIIAALSRSEAMTCILVDEVDNVTVDADLFYTFLVKTLPKRPEARAFYVFLTNRLEWEKSLDPRILSVMKKTDMIFEPYNARDLVEILNLRVDKALDQSRVDPASIRKIAACAWRETGGARRGVSDAKSGRLQDSIGAGRTDLRPFPARRLRLVIFRRLWSRWVFLSRDLFVGVG